MGGDTIEIDLADVTLEGELRLPANATGLIVFAHGSGSSRFSPRNAYVASVVYDRGLGTLLFDLLTAEEDANPEARFDIQRLTDRLVTVSEWLGAQESTRDLAIGYFGSSTGAAAALRAAASVDLEIGAVVTRGGRVDLAADTIPDISAPTQFIVGERDHWVLAQNTRMFELLTAEKSMVVVDGATHLFEEPGALEQVAATAADWFEAYLD